MTTNRYIYRCTGCLDVLALDVHLGAVYANVIGSAAHVDAHVGTCATCEQPVAYLGRVQRDRLVTDETAVKCDGACVHARGPLCNCKCGGANHSSGLAGYVTYTKDRGPVPVLVPPSAERAAKLKGQYLEFVGLLAEVVTAADALRARKARGEFIPRPDFDRMLRLNGAAFKARKAKTHASRVKTLRTALAA